MIARHELSRRTILGWGAAALALARSSRSSASSDSTPPNSEAIQGRSDQNHLMTLETHIDGQGPFQFVVDTGADESVIADDVAARLGLLNGSQVVVQGIARALPAQSVQINNLSFGHVRIDSLCIPVLSRALLGADGYLGLDAIDGRRVTFDFRENRLTVERSLINQSTTKFIRRDETLVRVTGSHGRLTAENCHIDGVRAYAFIDSGAEESIGNTSLFAKLQKIGKSYLSDVPVPIIGVTGGVASGRLTAISSIRIDALEFLHSTLVISDLPVFDVWGLSDKPAIFIGMNFLRKTSSFSIDYGNRELLIKLADVQIARAI